MNIRNGRELPGVWTEGAGRRFLSLLYRPEEDDIPDLAFAPTSTMPPMSSGSSSLAPVK